MRILYGLDALPRGLPLDHPRLAAATVDEAPLRLNTHPVPAAILAEAASGHEARVAALSGWLFGLAGPWGGATKRRIAEYLARITAAIAEDHAAIEARLARYHGLYAPQDFFWSAPRPLPRAWLVAPGAAPVFTELAFWNGREIVADPGPLAGFWREDGLPRSPFRRDQIVISMT